MRYQGGKGRIAAQLTPHILRIADGRRIVEPFCGGLSMSVALQPAFISDVSKPLATLIMSVRNGWDPPTFMSKEEHKLLRSKKHDVHDPLVCFAGQCCTFGGEWWAGYASGTKSQPDPIGTARKTLLRRVAQTAHIPFSCMPHVALSPKRGDVVYCDPPYAGVTQGYPTPKFDTAHFWEWVRYVAASGVLMLISEFSAPADATEIFQLARSPTQHGKRGQNRERLFAMGDTGDTGATAELTGASALEGDTQEG